MIPPLAVGLFDDQFLLETLTKLGNPLLKLNEFIRWEIFEMPIEQAFVEENRNDEPDVQYLSVCTIKNSSCNGIGMYKCEQSKILNDWYLDF